MALDNGEIIHYNTRVNGVWRSLVSRLVRVQEASGSNPDTPTMQSVLIGSEYPVMDTLLFYVKNGEKLELSIIIRSRTHSSLTLCSVSRSMYCFVMPQSRPKRSRLFTSTTSTFPARTASVSSCRAGRSRVNPEPCSAATPTMV